MQNLIVPVYFETFCVMFKLDKSSQSAPARWVIRAQIGVIPARRVRAISTSYLYELRRIILMNTGLWFFGKRNDGRVTNELLMQSAQAIFIASSMQSLFDDMRLTDEPVETRALKGVSYSEYQPTTLIINAPIGRTHDDEALWRRVSYIPSFATPEHDAGVRRRVMSLAQYALMS